MELVFYSLCDLDENIPLQLWQEKQLTEMEVIQLKFGDYAFPSSDENIPLQLWQEKQLTEMEVIHELKFGDYAFPSSDANSPASDTDSDSGNETMSICTTSTNFTAYSDSTSLLSLTDATSWEDLSKLPKNITGADLLVGKTEPQFV